MIVAQPCYTKNIELYTLNQGIIWYLIGILIKLLKEIWVHTIDYPFFLFMCFKHYILWLEQKLLQHQIFKPMTFKKWRKWMKT